MPDVVIENPVLNSPYAEPTRHFRFSEDGITNEVVDSGWEAKVAQTLEDMPEVLRYVKNQSLEFTIPYTLNGEEHDYIPDFIVVVKGTEGTKGELNLAIEVTGEKKKDKAEKVATAKTLWIPAVNITVGWGDGRFWKWMIHGIAGG